MHHSMALHTHYVLRATETPARNVGWARTWLETQTVRRLPPSLSAGMPTVSTSRPSYSCSRNLIVPSSETAVLWMMERPLRTPR